MSYSRVAVVILNYNGRKFLADFLPGVIQHSGNAQIYVVDNASTDDSVTFLQNYFPTVSVIGFEKNEGFCRGYNLALQQIEATYSVLLNSDVEVTPGWLEPLVKLMDANAVIAACQPKIRSYRQRNLFEYAGAAGGWIDYRGYPFCRGRIFEVLEEDRGQFNDTTEVFWATGACMMVRTDLYRRLGGLDEDFFAHMEEIDLCWRMKNAGYQVFYCGESEVYHVGGGTLAKTNPRKTFLNFRNGLALLYKNLPARALAGTILLRLVLDGVAGARFLLGGRPLDCWAIVRAHFSFYGGLPRWRRKRRQHPVPAQSLELRGVFRKSIVFAHFVQGKRYFAELFD